MRDVSVPVAASATCRAPHVALRFSPDGHVHACCVNDQFPLGHVDRHSIREIWDGLRATELRAALDDADFERGCQDCEEDYLLGQRTQTHAEQFDRFAQPDTHLEWPRRVEFALSNTCNLLCVHCNGDLSSAIRAQREHREPIRSVYGDQFFTELREMLPHVEVAVFIGGEPFLIRESRRVWDLMIEEDLHPEVHVTTNGTQWNPRVEHYLRALEMNVALSMDGLSATVNDAIRTGSDTAEVIENRDRFLAVTRSYGGSFTLNHCLLRANWRELGDFLLEGDRLDVDVHVIPVHYPTHLSLFALPADRLRPVLDHLEASAFEDRLGRNRQAWLGALGNIRARIAASERGFPVRVRTGFVDPPDDGLIASICEELTDWSGQSPLVIRSAHGRIDDVEVPSWAEPLGLSRFVGGATELFEAEMTALVGPREDEQSASSGKGFDWLRYRHRLDDDVAEFRTAILPEWGVITGTTATTLPRAT